MNHRPALELIVHPVGVSRLFAAGLAIGLLILIDSYLLLLAARRSGTYLLLAASASMSLAGALLAYRSYRLQLEKVWDRIRSGAYPRLEYARLLALLVGGGFLILPGFGSDMVGLVIMLTPLRRLVGTLLEKILRSRLKTLYEFLRLEH